MLNVDLCIFFFLFISFFFFFFSSRRRHTRLVSDWSSDVCSSDLSSVGRRIQRSRRSSTDCAHASANPRASVRVLATPSQSAVVPCQAQGKNPKNSLAKSQPVSRVKPEVSPNHPVCALNLTDLTSELLTCPSKPAQNHLNDGFGADQNLSAFSAGRLKCCSRLSWLSQEMAVRDPHSSRVWPGCSLSGCGPKPVRFFCRSSEMLLASLAAITRKEYARSALQPRQAQALDVWIRSKTSTAFLV